MENATGINSAMDYQSLIKVAHLYPLNKSKQPEPDATFPRALLLKLGQISVDEFESQKPKQGQFERKRNTQPLTESAPYKSIEEYHPTLFDEECAYYNSYESNLKTIGSKQGLPLVKMPYHNKAFRESEAEFLRKSRNIKQRQHQLSRNSNLSDLEKLRVNMVAIDSSRMMRNMRSKYKMSIEDLSSNYKADKREKPSVEELVQRELTK